MKRTLALFLSLLMVFSVFSCLNISAAENGNAEVGANYNLWLGSTRVTDANKNDILGDGTASFDSNTNTLRLNDPTISGFYYDSKVVCGRDQYGNPVYLRCKIYASDISLNVIGYYHMSDKNMNQHCYGLFVKNGSVTFDGDFEFYGNYCGIYVIGDVNIVGGRFKAMCYEDYRTEATSAGISATRKIRITSSIEFVEAIGINAGIAFGEIENDKAVDTDSIADYPHAPFRQGDLSNFYDGFNKDIKSYFYLDWVNDNWVVSKKPVRYVRFEVQYENHRYPVWLGRMQVTDSNKNDILYDGGKAKYDSDTGTLTLDDPTILGVVPDADSKIYSEKQLTVNGEYHMTSAEKNYGILSTSDLTLDGNFTFRGLNSAIRSSTRITSSNPTLYILNAVIEPNGGIINHDTVYGTDGKTAKNVRTGPGVTITFDANGGSGYMESVKVAKNTWYELPECAFAPPAGQEFRCWQAGTYVNPGSTINPSIDTTVKAIWRTADGNKCTVSFDPNGGSGTMYNVTVNKGSFYNAPECTFTAPEGRQFSHWTVNGERFDGATIRENTVLKASWVGAQIAYMDCSIAEPVVGSRPSYTIDVPYGAAYQQEWNYTGGLWGDGVAWEEVGGDAINYRSDYTFKPGRTYQVTISLVPVGGATFAQLSALRGYIDGKEAECFRYNASNVTLVRTFRTPESTILGDTDGDSAVTIIDATYIQRHLASIPIPFVLDEVIADTDEDGLVSIMDATYIQRWLAHLKSNDHIGQPM